MIVFFTDFGLQGPYVGQMHAVARALAPRTPLVDLMHDAPRFRPVPAGYLLAALVGDLPSAATLVAVVDPGVGTERRALALEVDRRRFVGPDNHLFDPLLRQAAGPARCRQIVWQPERLSRSFHGRDLFTPFAARWSCGDAPSHTEIDPATVLRPGAAPDLAEVIYVDGFGNAMTGLRADRLKPDQTLVLAGKPLPRAATFADVPQGSAFSYGNAHGLMEIAVNGGNAAATLGLDIGTPVGLA